MTSFISMPGKRKGTLRLALIAAAFLLFVLFIAPYVIDGFRPPLEAGSMPGVVASVNVFSAAINDALDNKQFTLADLERLDFEVPKDIEYAPGTAFSIFNIPASKTRSSMRENAINLKKAYAEKGYVWRHHIDSVTTVPGTEIIFNLRRYVRGDAINDMLFAIIPHLDPRLCDYFRETQHIWHEFRISPDNHQIVDDTDDFPPQKDEKKRWAFRCVIQRSYFIGPEKVYALIGLVGRQKKDGESKWKPL